MGIIKTRVGMPWCTERFYLLSERGQGGRHKDLIRKSTPKGGGIKSKTITKLFDKEVTTTLTVPSTIRTAVGGDTWSIILVKTSMKKLDWLFCFCFCFKKKNFAMFNSNFLNTGVIFKLQKEQNPICCTVFESISYNSLYLEKLHQVSILIK